MDRRGITRPQRCFRHFQARATGTQKAPFGPQNRQIVSDFSSKWQSASSSCSARPLANSCQRTQPHALVGDQPNRTASRQLFVGSFSQSATRINVAIGPSSSEIRNQFKPLRFFPCANPALMRASVPRPTAYSGVLFMGAVRALILGSTAKKHTGQTAGMGIVVGDCKRPTEGAWPGKSRVASTGLWPAGACLAGWDLGWVSANAHGPRDSLGQFTTLDANLRQFAKCCAFRLHVNSVAYPDLAPFGLKRKSTGFQ